MITIRKPGLFTTIQDLGRYGHQKYGVVVSGAMDSFSHRIANLLVGTEENAPTLEITVVGPVIQFHEDSLVAICGGDLSPMIDGKLMPMWRPYLIKKNSILSFGKCKYGCRAYMAIAGKMNVPLFLGSSSTYTRGKMGGLNGDSLKKNDIILLGPLNDYSKKIIQSIEMTPPRWSVPRKPLSPIVRVMKGRQAHLFSKESQRKFYESSFVVTKNADRMGYRLEGPPLVPVNKEEMLSEAVDFGTIQITPDGNPVILLADRQTTGGYPKIAQIISVDLPIVAQMKPGDRIQFNEVSLEEAQHLHRKEKQYIKMIKKAVEMKFR